MGRSIKQNRNKNRNQNKRTQKIVGGEWYNKKTEDEMGFGGSYTREYDNKCIEVLSKQRINILVEFFYSYGTGGYMYERKRIGYSMLSKYSLRLFFMFVVLSEELAKLESYSATKDKIMPFTSGTKEVNYSKFPAFRDEFVQVIKAEKEKRISAINNLCKGTTVNSAQLIRDIIDVFTKGDDSDENNAIVSKFINELPTEGCLCLTNGLVDAITKANSTLANLTDIKADKTPIPKTALIFLLAETKSVRNAESYLDTLLKKLEPVKNKLVLGIKNEAGDTCFHAICRNAKTILYSKLVEFINNDVTLNNLFKIKNNAGKDVFDEAITADNVEPNICSSIITVLDSSFETSIPGKVSTIKSRINELTGRKNDNQTNYSVEELKSIDQELTDLNRVNTLLEGKLFEINAKAKQQQETESVNQTRLKAIKEDFEYLVENYEKITGEPFSLEKWNREGDNHVNIGRAVVFKEIERAATDIRRKDIDSTFILTTKMLSANNMAGKNNVNLFQRIEKARLEYIEKMNAENWANIKTNTLFKRDLGITDADTELMAFLQKDYNKDDAEQQKFIKKYTIWRDTIIVKDQVNLLRQTNAYIKEVVIPVLNGTFTSGSFNKGVSDAVTGVQSLFNLQNGGEEPPDDNTTSYSKAKSGFYNAATGNWGVGDAFSSGYSENVPEGIKQNVSEFADDVNVVVTPLKTGAVYASINVANAASLSSGASYKKCEESLQEENQINLTGLLTGLKTSEGEDIEALNTIVEDYKESDTKLFESACQEFIRTLNEKIENVDERPSWIRRVQKAIENYAGGSTGVSEYVGISGIPYIKDKLLEFAKDLKDRIEFSYVKSTTATAAASAAAAAAAAKATPSTTIKKGGSKKYSIRKNKITRKHRRK